MNIDQKNSQRIFAVFMVALMALLVGLLYFFLFFDQPFLSYTNLPFPTNSGVQKTGKNVSLTVARCNSDNIAHTYNTTHTLEDTQRHVYYILPNIQVYINPGCSSVTSIINKIPQDIPAGNYRLIGVAEVRGVIRTHVVDWHSVPFDIIGTVHHEKENHEL